MTQPFASLPGPKTYGPSPSLHIRASAGPLDVYATSLTRSLEDGREARASGRGEAIRARVRSRMQLDQEAKVTCYG